MKLYCGSMAKTITDKTIQTMGGYGCTGIGVVGYLLRGTELLKIEGGTNENYHKDMVHSVKSRNMINID